MEIVLIALAVLIVGFILGVNCGVWYCHSVGKRALAQMIESGEVVIQEATVGEETTVRAVRLVQEGERWYAWTIEGGDFVAWRDSLEELRREIATRSSEFYVEEVKQ